MDEDSSSIFSRLKKIFRKNPQASFEEEINDLLDHGAVSGVLPKSAGDMIQSIVEFSDTVARKIMTPRISMVGVEEGATIGETIKIFQEEGYSRLPVYQGDMDHIVGFLMSKDLLKFWGEDLATTPLPKDIIRPAILVPGNKKIGDILTELRHRKSHLAVVLDEYGGTAGLITMEDIIEEIVGDIHDEYDEEEPDIAAVSPNLTMASGQAAIEDLSEYLGLDLPEGDYDTLGGFLTHQIGQVPQAGEKITWENLEFIIKAADNRKVEQVEIHKLSTAEIEAQQQEDDLVAEPATAVKDGS